MWRRLGPSGKASAELVARIVLIPENIDHLRCGKFIGNADVVPQPSPLGSAPQRKNMDAYGQQGLQKTGMKTGARNIHFIARANRLRETLQQDERLHFPVQQDRHNLPPVQPLFVDQTPASFAQHLANAPEIVETTAQKTQSRNRAMEATVPALVGIHSSQSNIHDPVPSEFRPCTFFRIVFGMYE